MDKINVAVGDAVQVFRNSTCTDCLYIDIVEKVLPNGRFKLSNEGEYWKADGTHNTHASRFRKDEVVKPGNLANYQQFYRYKTKERMARIGDDIGHNADLKLHFSSLVVINKILNSFGFKEDETINKLEEKINGKQGN